MNKTEKFWDKMAGKFDQRAKKFDKSYIMAIENSKKYLKSNNIVLDYGCGTGIISNELSGHAKEIHAIDISSKMIDAAEKKAAECKIENVHFAHATIFDDRYKKESFDVILVINILHLVEDTPQVVERMNTLLKPGGLLISLTPCLREKILLRILLFVLYAIRILPYIKLYKISELEDLIVKGNFEIIESKYLDNSPLDYSIIAKKI